MEKTEVHSLQIKTCKKYSVLPLPCPDHLKVGISLGVKRGELPIHGLRLIPEGETSGWYIWSGGEMSQAQDFFVPTHVSHIEEWNSLILPFLLFPSGWRFLIAPNFEDVWFDQSILANF